MNDYRDNPDYISLPQNLKDAYDNLPDGMRLVYTPKQYLWLTDAQRIDMEERDTLPDD